MIRLKEAFSRLSLFNFTAPAAFSLVALFLMLCLGGASARAGQASTRINTAQFASWVGKKFVMLPAPTRQGYDSFTVVRANGKSIRQFSGGDQLLSYSKFVGKTITCIAVQADRLVFHVPDYNIDIAYSLISDTDGTPDSVLDPNGVIIVDKIAPSIEIDAVRRAYLGKTVWVNYSNRGTDRNLPWPYDPVRKNTIQNFSRNRLVMADLPRGTQLIVTDVRWGGEVIRPVRLIVRDTANHYFCYEVAADRTNKGLKAGTSLDTADRSLSKTKPFTSP